MTDDIGFLADGHARARAAAEPHVRSQVESEYAKRLAACTNEERIRLRGEMAKVIAERIKEMAPPDALY